MGTKTVQRMRIQLHRPTRHRKERAERFAEEVLASLEDRNLDAAGRYMNALYHMYEPETCFERDYIHPRIEEELERTRNQAAATGADGIAELADEMLEYYQRDIYWMEARQG